MTRQSKRGILWSIFLSGLAVGCNPIEAAYFLFGPEPRVDPQVQALVSENKNKEIRVVVLVHTQPEVRPELANADRELSRAVVRNLTLAHKHYEEKVIELAPAKVDAYKADHPDWYQDLRKVGQHFQADYVIYIEIDKLSIFEEGSGNTLLRGKAEIRTSLVDISKVDADTRYHNDAISYPGESRYAFDSNDKTPQQFRQEFLDYVGKKVSFQFVPHPTRDEYSCQ